MDLKIRFSILLSLFLLLCVGAFSLVVFLQVKQKAYMTAEQNLTTFLEHEWSHLEHQGENSVLKNKTLHAAEVFYRIYKNQELIVDTFPSNLNPHPLVPSAAKEIANGKILMKWERGFGGENYILFGIYDLTTTLAYLGALKKVLFTGLLVTLLVIFPISWFLTRSLLRPFFLLSEKTSELDARNLSFRFSEPHRMDEYGRLVKSFNLLLDRLDRSFQQAKRFAANASHEFRTPLTVIRGEAEVMLRRPRERQDYEAALTAIEGQAKTLQAIIGRLLVLSDLERWEHHKAPVDVGKSIAESLNSFRFIHKETIREIDVRGEKLVFQGNQEIFSCVVGNLVENAIKYSSQKVLVQYGRVQGGVRFQVEDDGPGISEIENEKVFEPFHKGLGTPGGGQEQSGHGLGLSIVRACVDSVKGNIELGRSPLGGLFVQVTFPETLSPGSA